MKKKFLYALLLSAGLFASVGLSAASGSGSSADKVSCEKGKLDENCCTANGACLSGYRVKAPKPTGGNQ